MRFPQLFQTYVAQLRSFYKIRLKMVQRLRQLILYGMNVLLQENRDTGAAKRFFRRLIDDHELPERIVTDGLRSYGAALREVLELDASELVSVSALKRQNNLIE